MYKQLHNYIIICYKYFFTDETIPHFKNTDHNLVCQLNLVHVFKLFLRKENRQIKVNK